MEIIVNKYTYIHCMNTFVVIEINLPELIQLVCVFMINFSHTYTPPIFNVSLPSNPESCLAKAHALYKAAFESNPSVPTSNAIGTRVAARESSPIT